MSNDKLDRSGNPVDPKFTEKFLDIAMGMYGKEAKDKWHERKAERTVLAQTPLAIIKPSKDAIFLEEPNVEVVEGAVSPLEAETRLAQLLRERGVSDEFLPEPLDNSPLWDALDGSKKSPSLLDADDLNLKQNIILENNFLKKEFQGNIIPDYDLRAEEQRRQRQAELDAIQMKLEEEKRQRQAEIDAMMARREEERRLRQAEIDAMMARREEEKRYLYNEIKKPDVFVERKLSHAFNNAALDLDAPNVATPMDAIRMLSGRAKKGRKFG
jgi:hypothetical protein